MKNKLKNVTYACLAAIILLLVPLFLTKEKAIEVDLPTLDLREVMEQEEEHEKAAQLSARQAALRRIYQCETDEDCIIVDKDPCGCLSGPSGVTAINVTRTLEFDRLNPKSMAKACPDGEPSTDRECSSSAHAVCRANACKIEY
ncbi:MAG: hypothetical protein J6S81_05930 [Treponema sp.]|nr:hypothetical protein [Treponema sp.]